MSVHPARWLRLAEWAAALLVLAFLGRALAIQWPRIAAQDWSLDPARVALASALVLLAYSGFVVLWQRLLAALGAPLSLIDAHRIWYLGNLARYVPGKVLQLAGTAYMARAKGVSPVLSVAASLVSQLFVLAAAAVIAALTLPDAAGAPAGLRVAGLVLAAALVSVVFTPLFGVLYRLGLRLAGRPEHYAPIRWRERAWLLAGYLSTWIVFGAGFYFFLTALAPVPTGSWSSAVGICATGYAAGWLAIFVPGGIGVREGVYTVLLAQSMPASLAVAAALLVRVWMTAIELLGAGTLVLAYGLADLRAPAPREA